MTTTTTTADPRPLAEQKRRFDESAQLQESINAHAKEQEERRAAAEEERRRNPKPSNDHTRYSRGNGRAQYRLPFYAAPQWLVDSLPEAAAARDRWQATIVEADRLAAQVRAADQRMAEASRRGDDGSRVRGLGVSAEEFAEAETALFDAERALRANESRSLAALKQLDDASNGPGTDRRQIAASVARTQHEIASEALATLAAAIHTRDEASKVLDLTGRADWRTRSDLGALYGRLDGGLADALRILHAAVDGFGLAAIEQEAGR